MATKSQIRSDQRCTRLYITVCNNVQAGKVISWSPRFQGRKAFISVSISSNMMVLCIPMPSDLKSEHPQGVFFRKGQELRTSRMRRIVWNVRNDINVWAKLRGRSIRFGIFHRKSLKLIGIKRYAPTNHCFTTLFRKVRLSLNLWSGRIKDAHGYILYH